MEQTVANDTQFKGYDPRVVANAILDSSERLSFSITNIQLQKIAYFAHGKYLIHTDRPLFFGYFEAWKFGPVHPIIYRSFQSAKASYIDFRAECFDVFTGEKRPTPYLNDELAKEIIDSVIMKCASLPVSTLVQISHGKGGPWDYVVRQQPNRAIFGARIGNDVIRTRFKHHRALLGLNADTSEPELDEPLS